MFLVKLSYQSIERLLHDKRRKSFSHLYAWCTLRVLQGQYLSTCRLATKRGKMVAKGVDFIWRLIKKVDANRSYFLGWNTCLPEAYFVDKHIFQSSTAQQNKQLRMFRLLQFCFISTGYDTYRVYSLQLWNRIFRSRYLGKKSRRLSSLHISKRWGLLLTAYKRGCTGSIPNSRRNHGIAYLEVHSLVQLYYQRLADGSSYNQMVL